jgi:hypothetical protein
LREKLAAERELQAADEEIEALALMKGLERQIAQRPALKRKLAEAKAAIDTVPGLRQKVDPNLVRALDMIGESLTDEE